MSLILARGRSLSALQTSWVLGVPSAHLLTQHTSELNKTLLQSEASRESCPVSIARRLFSQTQIKMGYAPNGVGVFNPELTAAMQTTDSRIQNFLYSMVAAGTANSTAVILTAKHGQNPLDSGLVRCLADCGAQLGPPVTSSPAEAACQPLVQAYAYYSNIAHPG